MGWGAVIAVFSDPRDGERTCFETRKLTQDGESQSVTGLPVTVCYLREDLSDVTCYAQDRFIARSVTPSGASLSENWATVCDAANIAAVVPAGEVINEGKEPPPGITYDDSMAATTTGEAEPLVRRNCPDAPELDAMEISTRGASCLAARSLIQGFLARGGPWTDSGYRCKQVTESDMTFWRCRASSGSAVTWFFFSEVRPASAGGDVRSRLTEYRGGQEPRETTQAQYRVSPSARARAASIVSPAARLNTDCASRKRRDSSPTARQSGGSVRSSSSRPRARETATLAEIAGVDPSPNRRATRGTLAAAASISSPALLTH